MLLNLIVDGQFDQVLHMMDGCLILNYLNLHNYVVNGHFHHQNLNVLFFLSGVKRSGGISQNNGTDV